MAPLIQVQELFKSYRRDRLEIPVLRNINLAIAEGEFIAFMGPSGSGKTTLLNLIAGIDKPTAGKIFIAGIDVTELNETELALWRSRNIGFIFQFYNLIPVLTALENVELPLILTPLSKHERRAHAETALDVVGLADRLHHFPRQLSGGQEQRVAIARAIASDPGRRRAYRRSRQKFRRRDFRFDGAAQPRVEQDHSDGHARSARSGASALAAAVGQGRVGGGNN